VLAYCSLRNGQHRIDLPGLASFLFDSDTAIVTAIPDPSVRPSGIVDIYHHAVLPVVLQALGTEVLHASAVLTRRGVVALCGGSGAGKSTLAFGLSRRGYPIWADDAVAVETHAAPRSVPLPYEIRLRPAAATFFGQGIPACPLAAREEARSDRRPGLAALCVLNWTAGMRGEVAVERLRPSAAFSAVLAHAYCFSLQGAERKQQLVRHYLDLTARVPVFDARFEAHLDGVPAVLDAIEQTVVRAAKR